MTNLRDLPSCDSSQFPDQPRRAATQMGEASWPTIWLAVTSVLCYFLLIGLTAAGWLPLILAFLSATYLVYATYTPLHEAVHRNICGRHRKLLWLNDLVGYLVATVLGVSYTMHRAAHMDDPPAFPRSRAADPALALAELSLNHGTAGVRREDRR